MGKIFEVNLGLAIGHLLSNENVYLPSTFNSNEIDLDDLIEISVASNRRNL